MTHVVFSSVPSQFIEELEKVIALIRDIQDELQSPILHGQLYEDFSRQEDKLKVGSSFVNFSFFPLFGLMLANPGSFCWENQT